MLSEQNLKKKKNLIQNDVAGALMQLLIQMMVFCLEIEWLHPGTSFYMKIMYKNSIYISLFIDKTQFMAEPTSKIPKLFE